MTPRKKSKKFIGFTLIELVIYISILSIITIVVANSFISLTKGKSNVEAKSEVNSNLRFAIEKMKRDVASATSLVEPNTVSFGSSNLNLIVGGQTINYVISNSRITRQVNSNPVEYITSDKVKISSLALFRSENRNAVFNKRMLGVQINVTGSYNSGSPDLQYTQTETTSVDLNQVFDPAGIVGCDGMSGVFYCGNSCLYKGDTYSTVAIGSQCWFGENLRTTVYPNDTPITKGNPTNGVTFGTSATANYSCPPNENVSGYADGEDCAAASSTLKLGMLYQWNAIMNGAAAVTSGPGPQGICPANWHIPSDDLTATSDIGKLIASVSAISGCNGNEATCLRTGGSANFNLPWAGYRTADGWYFKRTDGARLWTASDDQPNYPRFDKFEQSAPSRANNNSNDMANTVRCVHD